MDPAEPAPIPEVAPAAAPPARRKPVASNAPKWLAALLLALAVAVSIGVRMRLLDFPLERDEGEYAYAGQLIQEGIPPYTLAYNMKMPGTYLAYAAIMSVFGQTTSGIHLGLLVTNLATLALLFLLAKRCCGVLGAATAVAAYALMTLSPALLGLAGHATHFVVLPALAGLLLVLRPGERGRLWVCLAAGLCFGVAFLMKQPGLFLGIFGGLYLNYFELLKRPIPHGKIALRVAGYALGCILPFLGVCLWLGKTGAFHEFWFWTIDYARAYASIMPLAVGLQNAQFQMQVMFEAAPVLWILAGLGMLVGAVSRLAAGHRVFLFGFLLFSFLSTCPGLYFRNHYFITFLPAGCLFMGMTVRWLGAWMAQMKFGASGDAFTTALAAAACAQSLYADRAVLFSLAPDAACRAVYGLNPFPESPEIAKYLESKTSKGETIVVLGSEPQIYFDAHRHSATGYIYAYPLMEDQPFAVKMQDEMIQQIERNHPSYFVFVSISTSWLGSARSSRQIFGWFENYRAKHLEAEAIFQSTAAGNFEAVWGPTAKDTKVLSNCSIVIYKNITPVGTEPNPPANSAPSN